jgi:hypothetical protein
MYQPNQQWPSPHHHMPYYQPYHSPSNGPMNYMHHQPPPKKRGWKQESSIPPGYQGFGQQQSWSPPKKPSLMKAAFTGEDGSFDVGRTFQTVDQVVKTVQQVSPIVKQVSPLVKQMSALFIKK